MGTEEEGKGKKGKERNVHFALSCGPIHILVPVEYGEALRVIKEHALFIVETKNGQQELDDERQMGLALSISPEEIMNAATSDVSTRH